MILIKQSPAEYCRNYEVTEYLEQFDMNALDDDNIGSIDINNLG